MIRTVADIEQVRYTRDKLDNLVLRTNGEFTGRDQDHYFGMLAEVVIADLLEQERPLVRNESDAGTDFVINGVKVDVKCSTRTRKPLWNHHAVVSELQRNNATDAYLFVGYNKVQGRFYIIGWCYKEDWQEKSTLILKGQPLPQETPKVITTPCDCRVMKYKYLRRLKDFEDLHKIGEKKE